MVKESHRDRGLSRKTGKRENKFKDLPQKPTCQCSANCPNAPLKDKPWCEAHKDACPLGPTNGYEPPLEIEYWNKTYALRESHNCLAYAPNKIDMELVDKCNEPSCPTKFPQPG